MQKFCVVFVRLLMVLSIFSTAKWTYIHKTYFNQWALLQWNNHISRENTPLDPTNINLETFCIILYSLCFKVFIISIKLNKFTQRISEIELHPTKFLQMNVDLFFIWASQPHYRIYVLLFPFYSWGNLRFRKLWIGQIYTTSDRWSAGVFTLQMQPCSIRGLRLSSDVIFSNNPSLTALFTSVSPFLFSHPYLACSAVVFSP